MPFRPQRTFFRKLVFATGALVLMTTGLVGYVALSIARRHLTQELAEKLISQGRILAERAPTSSKNSSEILDDWADRCGELTGARVSLIALSGRVLGDSRVDFQRLGFVENHSGRPEIRSALSGGRGTSIRRSATVGVEFLYAAVPVRRGGAALGTLRLAMPLSEVNVKLGSLRRAILLASVLCFAGALGLSIYVSRSISRPVAALSAAAERFSHGDFEARAEVEGADELSRLAEVLNLMARRVSEMVATISGDRARLRGTIDYMVEAVALVGSDGCVQELNPVMEKLFGSEASAARGKPFVEVARLSALERLLRDALDRREPRFGEIALPGAQERIFEAYVNPIAAETGARGVVIVLHEITRLRRLEEMRKEFVANVSHELRTPLASIKGFAETLRRGGVKDKKNRMEFVESIERHSDRLTRIVDDLLELAAIESGKRELTREVVRLSVFVDDVFSSLSPIARKKDVRLVNAIASDLAARADKPALRQILQNLVDNGIKYNRRNGRVEVGAHSEGGRVNISVADTGVGIPSKDLPRLFERFYRVDKARSRAMGGTGLGLSIVKHLVEGHGGRISAASREDQGATFRFSLPAV